jgi:hypothetical protein
MIRIVASLNRRAPSVLALLSASRAMAVAALAHPIASRGRTGPRRQGGHSCQSMRSIHPSHVLGSRMRKASSDQVAPARSLHPMQSVGRSGRQSLDERVSASTRRSKIKRQICLQMRFLQMATAIPHQAKVARICEHALFRLRSNEVIVGRIDRNHHWTGLRWSLARSAPRFLRTGRLAVYRYRGG